MDFLIILLCGFLSCAKVTIQGRLARQSIKNTNDSILANCLIFAFTTILFSTSLINGINANVIGYSVFFGFFSASFQVFYALALKTGPFSISCMLINLSMIIPAIFSIIVFGEELTLLKVVGFLMCLAAMFINTKSDDKKTNIKWFLYVILAFLSTGGISVVQKIYAKSVFAGDLTQFIALGNFVAFMITFIVSSIQRCRSAEINFKINRSNVMLILVIVTSLGAFQYFNTLANSFIDALVLNPSVCGLSTIFSTLSGGIIFKEKFTPRQLWSVCVGIAAIILISL